MRFTPKLIGASLFTLGVLFAQDAPPPGFGGPGPGGPGGFGMRGPHGAPVTGAPYSATKTETRQETLTDGNQIQQTHTEKVYRDTEGRTRTEATMTTPSGTTRTMITIFDPVAGFMAHLNPADSTAMKMTLHTPPSGMAQDRPKPPAGENAPQMAKTDLGASTVAGLAATGTRTTVTIPAGAMGNTQAMVENARSVGLHRLEGSREDDRHRPAAWRLQHGAERHFDVRSRPQPVPDSVRLYRQGRARPRRSRWSWRPASARRRFSLAALSRP